MDVLNEKQVLDKLSGFSGWNYNDDHIGKEFQLEDFKGALDFVNNVGREAESMDHHPDILIHSWNKVRISVATHSAGGVTEKDIELAGKIEKIKI